MVQWQRPTFSMLSGSQSSWLNNEDLTDTHLSRWASADTNKCTPAPRLDCLQLRVLVPPIPLFGLAVVTRHHTSSMMRTSSSVLAIIMSSDGSGCIAYTECIANLCPPDLVWFWAWVWPIFSAILIVTFFTCRCWSTTTRKGGMDEMYEMYEIYKRYEKVWDR